MLALPSLSNASSWVPVSQSNHSSSLFLPLPYLHHPHMHCALFGNQLCCLLSLWIPSPLLIPTQLLMHALLSTYNERKAWTNKQGSTFSIQCSMFNIQQGMIRVKVHQCSGEMTLQWWMHRCTSMHSGRQRSPRSSWPYNSYGLSGPTNKSMTAAVCIICQFNGFEGLCLASCLTPNKDTKVLTKVKVIDAEAKVQKSSKKLLKK